MVAEIAEDKGWGLGKGIDFSGTPTLADVIAGIAPGRFSEDEATCFINNLAWVPSSPRPARSRTAKRKQAGRGHELPTEWFTQDVHP